MSSQENVTNYWEKEVCGTRFVEENEIGKERAIRIAESRYHIEKYIPSFAGFNEKNRGLRVLEIGVGAGTDFAQWIKSGAECYGIDITEASVKEARKNVESILGVGNYDNYEIKLANAESLPFEDGFFDIVYSHGVLHHAKNTMKCLYETSRVLKPGGKLKIMVYSSFSATGIMLWIIHGLLKGKPFKSQEDLIFRYLESPGTKCYSKKEFAKILSGFGLVDVNVKKFAGSGDLLRMPPSKKYKTNFLYNIAKLLYPTFLVSKFQGVLGLALTATSTKPLGPAH